MTRLSGHTLRPTDRAALIARIQVQAEEVFGEPEKAARSALSSPPNAGESDSVGSHRN
jgi:hypothetical protein